MNAYNTINNTSLKTDVFLHAFKQWIQRGGWRENEFCPVQRYVILSNNNDFQTSRGRKYQQFVSFLPEKYTSKTVILLILS